MGYVTVNGKVSQKALTQSAQRGSRPDAGHRWAEAHACGCRWSRWSGVIRVAQAIGAPSGWRVARRTV